MPHRSTLLLVLLAAAVTAVGPGVLGASADTTPVPTTTAVDPGTTVPAPDPAPTPKPDPAPVVKAAPKPAPTLKLTPKPAPAPAPAVVVPARTSVPTAPPQPPAAPVRAVVQTPPAAPVVRTHARRAHPRRRHHVTHVKAHPAPAAKQTVKRSAPVLASINVKVGKDVAAARVSSLRQLIKDVGLWSAIAAGLVLLAVTTLPALVARETVVVHGRTSLALLGATLAAAGLSVWMVSVR